MVGSALQMETQPECHTEAEQMSKTLSPINDTSSRAFDDLFARFQELDLECLLIYLFDKVEESALIHLAEQFHITGNEGWAYCQTTEEKRELNDTEIRKSIF